jgi:hypothetical protein
MGNYTISSIQESRDGFRDAEVITAAFVRQISHARDSQERR